MAFTNGDFVFFYAYGYFTCMCVCASCMCSVHRGQKRASEPGTGIMKGFETPLGTQVL